MSSGANGTQQSETRERQEESNAWDSANDQILERLANNEKDSTPWPELRRIIRQKLTLAVEDLVKQSKESERRKGEPEDAEMAQSDNDDNDNDNDNSGKKPASEPDTPKGKESTNTSAMDTDDAKATLAVPSTGAASDVAMESAASSNGGDDDDTEQTRDIHDLEERIGYSLHTFDSAPFTIQRIAELLSKPQRHYRNVIKYLRAVERTVYVTSTVDEFPTTSTPSGQEEAIEDGTRADAPSSLFSFLATQEVHSLGSKPQSALKSSGASGSPGGSVMAATGRPPRSADVQREVEALRPELGSGRTGGDQSPLLDASDTGILHITPASLEEETVLRTKLRDSVDSSVPVKVDHVPGPEEKHQ
ncbi:hypothetical protein FBU59_000146 [Linderina macrospora]|uniref:Uncharacterized protein n=1 Tax=Linderina macrospora TaxID=4868 RepID=A0ACC1JHF4_9FUNG|nr:hypothetical protein FBU59_000146 [Linderina macrospora]